MKYSCGNRNEYGKVGVGLLVLAVGFLGLVPFVVRSAAAPVLIAERNHQGMQTVIPDWVVYPKREWLKISPAEAGFDEAKFNEIVSRPTMVRILSDLWNKGSKQALATLRRYLKSSPKGGDFGGELHDGDTWGAVLTRGGYLVQTWGDPDYKYQSASVGKAFTRAVFGLAVDNGLIKPDDLIYKSWSGEGQLSHSHKYLNQGHHETLTWQDLLTHRGGFPVTNGYYWKRGLTAGISPFPKWAKPTGDPFYDNYSHTTPGVFESYSSGGYWRLAQALTALWERDIKWVLDEKLFRHMDIPPDRWDWTAGKVVQDTEDWYPDLPGYGDFIDPPYEVDGHVVRGGQWVVMSAKDLARFGLLIATRGVWNGKKLISPEWIQSHKGGNGSLVAGEPATYISIGMVTSQGVPYQLLQDAIGGPVAVSSKP